MAAREGFAIEFSLAGEKNLLETLRAVASVTPRRAGAALIEEAKIEFDESQRRVPFLFGNLRRSGRVDGPEFEDNGIVARISYGRGIEPYAVKQHVMLKYVHDIGQANYLGSVVKESRKFLAARVARRLEIKP